MNAEQVDFIFRATPKEFVMDWEFWRVRSESGLGCLGCLDGVWLYKPCDGGWKRTRPLCTAEIQVYSRRSLPLFEARKHTMGLPLLNDDPLLVALAEAQENAQ